MSLEDREYVEAALAGECDAFEALARKYNRMGGAIAYGILGDFHQAEDAVQEAFFKAFQSLGSLRDPAKFKVWFAGIVRSKAIDVARLRREKSMTELGTAELREELPLAGRFRSAPNAETEQIHEEVRAKVLEALSELPSEDRTVLVLKHMEGLSYKEIAEVTGASVSAVESRLFRARQALRKKLDSSRIGEENV
jgi:RNA polymerase sigma-70 factor (ECF subfamily)